MYARLVALLYQIVIFGTSLPIQIYLLLQWKQHQNHFVILNRFPKITIAAVIISFVACLSAITHTIIKHSPSSDLSIGSLVGLAQGLAFLQEGLVFYRALLVYYRYVVTARYLDTILIIHGSSLHLDTIIKSSTNTAEITMSTDILKTSECRGIILNAMFIFIIVFSILTAICHDVEWLNPGITFAPLIIIGIIIIFNMCRVKVKTSIGVVQEIALSCLVTVIVIILSAMAGPGRVFFTAEQSSWFAICTGTTFQVVMVALVLYVPLRLIKQGQATTRDIQQTLSRMQSLSTEAKSDSEPDSARSKSPSSDMQQMYDGLNTFLKDHGNYKIFAQYLSRCFCLECLLFCERVLILYHIILKYKTIDTDFAQNNEENVQNDIHDLYDLKFYYLSHIYDEMDSVIQTVVNKRDNIDRMKYRNGILSVMDVIYKQFCREDSPTQINIRSDVFNGLLTLFENKEDKDISDQFDSYDKLLWIFDDALRETWQLCEYVYGFRFQLYMKQME